jgi:hypothetical protein
MAEPSRANAGPVPLSGDKKTEGDIWLRMYLNLISLHATRLYELGEAGEALAMLRQMADEVQAESRRTAWSEAST